MQPFPTSMLVSILPFIPPIVNQWSGATAVPLPSDIGTEYEDPIPISTPPRKSFSWMASTPVALFTDAEENPTQYMCLVDVDYDGWRIIQIRCELSEEDNV